MPEHLEFLKRRKSTILSAGPLFDVGSGKGAGGQWIVEAFDLAEVQRLVEEDPFFPSGLRKSIRILEWKLVFENGVSRI